MIVRGLVLGSFKRGGVMADLIAGLLDLLEWLGPVVLFGCAKSAWSWLHQRWSTWTESRHARHLAEQVGRDGLSGFEIRSFANWIASSSTTACELLADLKKSGCNIVWGWDDLEQSWLRCSLDSDGNLVPGSADFSIEQDMVLYLAG